MGDIAAKESSSNPLYLSSILQRFFMMDGKEFGEAERLAPGMDGIHCYMEKLLAGMPDRQEDMVLYLLKAAMDHFEAEYLYEVLCLITLSRSGLTETELSDLLRTEGRHSPRSGSSSLPPIFMRRLCRKRTGSGRSATAFSGKPCKGR